MYLASLKQTVRLYPYVLLVVVMTILEALFPEEQVVIGLAMVVLLFVLQYEAFSQCLPTDVRIPVPVFNKVVGFVFRFVILSIISSIPPFLLFLLFIGAIQVFPESLALLGTWTGKIVGSLLFVAFSILSYCYVLAKLGLILPAGIAGYDSTLSTAMDRSMGKVRLIVFRLLSGPVLLFIAPFFLSFFGLMISSLAGLDGAEGEMSLWLSVPVAVLSTGFICWGEVMIAVILSNLFLEVRTITPGSTLKTT